jgi:flagellar basal-body rod protein FlgB
MSRTTERHTKLTGNLANVNTPGYKRKDLDFHILLDKQMGGSAGRREQIRDRLAQRASERVSLRSDGNNVDMEREVFAIAQTELRYQALTDMTARYFTGLKTVIREGK